MIIDDNLEGRDFYTMYKREASPEYDTDCAEKYDEDLARFLLLPTISLVLTGGSILRRQLRGRH